MARRKAKIKPWFKTLLFIFVVVVAGTYLYLNFFGNSTKSNSNNDNKSKDKPVQKETKKVYKASMIMAGDGLLHGAVYKDAKNANGDFDFTNQLEYVKELIKDYDIKYWNQETIFGGKEKGKARKETEKGRRP